MISFGMNDTITNMQGFLQYDNKVEKKEGKPLKELWGILLAILIGIAMGCWAYAEFQMDAIGGFLLFMFAALWFYISVVALFRFVNDRRVAAYMRKSGLATQRENVPLAKIKKTVEQVPPFKMDVYEQNELPMPAFSYQRTVSAESNIIGIKPKRILFFYNFYEVNKEYVKAVTMMGWRRHGPVYFLGSPHDISMNNTFALNIRSIVKQQLITTEAQLQQRLATATEDVLPPASKQLKATAYFTGGYPQHIFLCTDKVWQQAAKALIDKADIVIVDASDFNLERKGLNWELQQLVDYVPTESFVVIINKYTDLPALGETFKAAWKNMAMHSPNNKPSPAPLKMVFLEEGIRIGKDGLIDIQDLKAAFEKEVPEVFQNLIPKATSTLLGLRYSILQRMLVESLHYDKILGLIINSPVEKSQIAAAHK